MRILVFCQMYTLPLKGVQNIGQCKHINVHRSAHNITITQILILLMFSSCQACGKKPSVTSPPPSPGIYKTTSNPLAQVNADPKAKAEREKKAAKARQTRDDARKRLIAAKRAAARKRVKSEDGEPPVEIFVPDK